MDTHEKTSMFSGRPSLTIFSHHSQQSLYTLQGFFCVHRGRNSAPFPMEFRWLFPQYWFFFFEDWDFHSVTTHTSYIITWWQSTTIASYFSFNLMAKVCEIAIFFLLIKNDIIVYYDKFPSLGVYHANFPNLKGTGPLPKLQKKSLALSTTYVLW